MASHAFTRVFALGLLALSALTLACDSVKPSGLSVLSVSPRVAMVGTSTDVRISGTGFRAGATVSVGQPATNVAVVSSTMINATVVAQNAGILDVVVTNPNGDTTKLAAGFTFEMQVSPTVTSVVPTSGLAGDTIRVVGTGFKTGMRLTVDGLPATFAIVESITAIRFGPPEHAPGPVDVVVTNPDGQTAGLPQAFTYQLVILSVSTDTVTSGSPLSISWAAPSGRSTLDWIALYKPGSPHVAYADLWWSYTNGAATGTFTIPAPAPPGPYEFRYFANDGYDMAMKSGLINVTSTAPESRQFLRAPGQ
jgi:hypothetical protein